jgi:hypothetical protein
VRQFEDRAPEEISWLISEKAQAGALRPGLGTTVMPNGSPRHSTLTKTELIFGLEVRQLPIAQASRRYQPLPKACQIRLPLLWWSGRLGWSVIRHPWPDRQ